MPICWTGDLAQCSLGSGWTSVSNAFAGAGWLWYYQSLKPNFNQFRLTCPNTERLKQQSSVLLKERTCDVCKSPRPHRSSSHWCPSTCGLPDLWSRTSWHLPLHVSRLILWIQTHKESMFVVPTVQRLKQDEFEVSLGLPTNKQTNKNKQRKKPRSRC